MYPVSANFHTLAIQDAPKTRVRIYFIGDAVDCTDDNAVQTNGTLLVGKAGDTDSNGRIGQNGITFSEFFNPDKNIQVGAAVSSQIGMTLLNTDGALDNFQYGRCKVYLDVYDAANSSWLTCPMGVYIIDLPTKRKVQLINATGYDQMQKLDEICDTWWSALNWSGGITLSQLLTSLATQIGVSVSSNTASAIVNGSVSFTEEPFQCIEVTYREVLEYIAEATGTVARFDRNGALDLRWFAAAQISGNTVTVNTDTIGNQCLAISVAEYSVAAVDLLKVKLYTDDIGTTVGTGTNQYTIVNNLFLDGANSSAIIAKATPIYNRLHGLDAYSPVSARIITDWSIEAGDIINIVHDSTTYSVPIFQQSMAWRGGYVVSDLLSDGDNVRPVLDYDERTYYRLNSEMSKKVGDNEIISKINQSPESITIQANKVNLTGYVTFTNLSTDGQTSISGGNIITGSITADKLNANNINASKTLTVGAMTDAAAATVLNSNVAIGGRNLCTGTAVSNEFTKSPNGNWFLPIGVWPISTYGGVAFADTANTQWTASFDYSITGVDAAFTLRISPKTSESSYEGGINVANIPVGSSSGHATGTGTIVNGARDYAGTSGVLFLGMGDTNANAVLTVSNLKVEIGNKATSWTQAPEDVAADIATAQSTAEGANSQEQLIYRSKAVGTTSISGTTTWVTNTTGNQDAWTIKRPQYNTSYPVMFIATQRKNVAGTVTCTTPQIDDTITVIDGGNIITGTVTANQIAGGTITSTNLATALNNTINTASSNASTALSNAATAQSTAESANSQEQLIYISKASGTTTQPATTTWVTNTTGNQNTWTIKRPTYNSSYPVLFVATQRKSVGGTVTCTTPQIDNTTTVIDGGHITTGTIDASVVNVSNINADNIKTGTLKAITIQDTGTTPSNYWDLNGGNFVATNGSIGGFTLSSSGLSYGSVRPEGSGTGFELKGKHIDFVADDEDGRDITSISAGGLAFGDNTNATPGVWRWRTNLVPGTMNVDGTSREYFGIRRLNPPNYTTSSDIVEFTDNGTNFYTRFNGDVKATGDLTVGGVLDVTPRRCYAASLAAGWHRVLTFYYGTSSATGDAYAKGGTGSEVVLHITRRRTTYGEENHDIKMLCTYNGIKFADETSASASGYQAVDKVRYTYKGSYAYVDIHLTNTVPHVTVAFEVYCEPEYQALYTAASLQSVGDSPSGETVLAEYSFSENVPESGSGYSKNPDGTMIQWGGVSGLSFANQNMISGTTTLPQSFVNTSYTVLITPGYTGVNSFILRAGASPSTVNSFGWVLGSGDSTNINASGRDFKYFAIGRWK